MIIMMKRNSNLLMNLQEDDAAAAPAAAAAAARYLPFLRFHFGRLVVLTTGMFLFWMMTTNITIKAPSWNVVMMRAMPTSFNTDKPVDVPDDSSLMMMSSSSSSSSNKDGKDEKTSHHDNDSFSSSSSSGMESEIDITATTTAIQDENHDFDDDVDDDADVDTSESVGVGSSFSSSKLKSFFISFKSMVLSKTKTKTNNNGAKATTTSTRKEKNESTSTIAFSSLFFPVWKKKGNLLLRHPSSSSSERKKVDDSYDINHDNNANKKEEEREDEDEDEDGNNNGGRKRIRMVSNQNMKSSQNNGQKQTKIAFSSSQQQRWLQQQPDDDIVVALPLCSNISEGFQTSVLVAYEGNRSLATDDQASLIGQAFFNAYNNLRIGGTTRTTTTTVVCDPLFRVITEVRASTDASFTGSNNGELLENPIQVIPVRKLFQQQQQKLQVDAGNHQDLSATSAAAAAAFEAMIRESLQQQTSTGKLVDVDDLLLQEQQRRQLQQQPQQPQPPQTPLASLNRTLANTEIGFILLDIFGACRGCRGGTLAFNLFDDTSKPGQQRLLQEEGEGGDDLDDGNTGTGDCICPSNSVAPVDSTSFETAFQEDVEELRDTGEIDFIQDVNEIIPVLETECPTKDQDFSTVYFVTNVEFSTTLLLSSGSEGVQAMERLFRESYNGVAQQVCDPLYRAISKTQFVSINEEIESDESTTPRVRFEFIAYATCRGEGCTNNGRLFDEESSNTRLLFGNVVNDDLEAFVYTNTSSRFLQEEVEEESERCFCRKGRSVRPPTQQEFKTVFQQGLTRFLQENKLSSCQDCTISADCKSGVCRSGRCAESGTGLFKNGCQCDNNDICESGFCEANTDNDTTDGVGTCQGKLPSCGICLDGDSCLSGQCLGNRCAEAFDGKLTIGCDCSLNLQCQSGRCLDDVSNPGIAGACAEKITDTCTEPCLVSSDCASGRCGSVVCLPNNGTLLPNGCLSSSSLECASSGSLDGVCILQAQPSSTPSSTPSDIASSTPSRTPIPTHQPSSSPSFSPSTSQPSSTPSELVCSDGFYKYGGVCVALDDCFEPDGGTWDMNDVMNFCNAHDGDDQCCSDGTNACLNLDANTDRDLKICRGSCRGDSACQDFGGDGGDGLISIEIDSCQGSSACNSVGFSSSSIQIGSGSCNQDDSCNFLGQAAESSVSIGTGSCTADSSCYWLARETRGSVSIGDTSCKGDRSCYFIGRSANGIIEVIVGANSCVQFEACYFLAYNTDSEGIDIGDDSCRGSQSCWYLGAENSFSVTIGTDACIDDLSCYQCAETLSGDVDLADDTDNCATESPTETPSTSQPSSTPSELVCSDGFYKYGGGCVALDDCFEPDGGTWDMADVMNFCNAHDGDDQCCSDGTNACLFLGANTDRDLKICRGSCRGDSACDSLGGGEGNGQISIDINSCQGLNACSFVGFSSSSIQIGSGSCNQDNSCNFLGQNAGSSVTIGAGSCTALSSCSYLASRTTGSVSIGGASCKGDRSCYFLGYNADDNIAVVVGGNACVQVQACFSLARETASQGINIGNNSCRGSQSCWYLGAENSFSVTIGTDACIDDLSCYQCRETLSGVVNLPGGTLTCNPNGDIT